MKPTLRRSVAIVVLLACTNTSSFAQGRPDSPGHCGPGDQSCGARSNRYMHGDDRNDNRGQEQRGQERRGYDDREHWRGERRDGEYGAGPSRSYYRGERLPPQYNQRQYVVDDWRGHGLHSPPRGYHWVQTGADYVLVAITTGLILELLLNR